MLLLSSVCVRGVCVVEQTRGLSDARPPGSGKYKHNHRTGQFEETQRFLLMVFLWNHPSILFVVERDIDFRSKILETSFGHARHLTNPYGEFSLNGLLNGRQLFEVAPSVVWIRGERLTLSENIFTISSQFFICITNAPRRLQLIICLFCAIQWIFTAKQTRSQRCTVSTMGVRGENVA